MDRITPFAAAKVTNLVLKANGITDTEVRPQMLYAYAKNARIASNYGNRGSEKVYFEGEAFKTWLDKYVIRVQNGESTSGTDYEAIAAEYMAEFLPEGELSDEEVAEIVVEKVKDEVK
jgi:hypothetical protein